VSSRRGGAGQDIEHIGSAHDDAGVELLKAAARQRLAAGLGELDLGLDGAVGGSGGPLPITSSRMEHLWEALACAYEVLGFESATEGDEVFRALVLARVIEPTSKLDSLRVLEEAGIDPPSYQTMNRRLPVFATDRWRQRLAAACAAHARLGPASLVLFDVSTLHFETDTADGFREPGFSKERRLDPQIVIGLLTDAAGFPLMVHAFEGNTAETKTLPVITAFMAADQLTDVNVVADAGMISDANKRAIEAARLSFILGLRIPDLPCVVAQWRRHHPGQQIPDGHIFTQPWPAGPTDKRRDQVIYYQYRHDRARRALRGIDTQVAKAEKAVAGAAPVKRNRFISLSGGTRSVNRALEAKARAIAGLKGYVTGTVALSVHMIARWEIFLYDSCVRPQVDPFGYQRTPVGSICGPLAELGRRSCGADVAGWLNATVPGPVGVGGRVPDLPTAGDPHPAGRRGVSSALPHGPGRQPWGRSWGCSSPSGSWPAAGRPTCSARRSTPSGERTANRAATVRATPVMTVPPSG